MLTSPLLLDPRRIRTQLHVSRTGMARLMDVSAKTIQGWEERGLLPGRSEVRKRLARQQEMVDLGTIVYTPDAQFLITPLPSFGGRTAVQMIEQGRADAVLAALAADYEGLGY